MATLTILTDDESSNTKLITTSPTIFGGNHHVVDISNEVAPTENSTVTMDLSSPKTSLHRPRKQRHEHLLAIPLDEEDTLQYNLNHDAAANCYTSNEHLASSAKAVAASTEQLTTPNTPVGIKRRGRPKKNALNSAATAAAVTTHAAAAAMLNDTSSIGAVDTPGTDGVSKSRRVELLRKRLAIDMVDAEQPSEEQDSTVAAVDTEASKRERIVRTGARTSRRTILPGGALTPTTKIKSSGNNGEVPIKGRKRSVNALLGGSATIASTNTTITNSVSDSIMSVLNHYGGSNSSISSAYSSSSMSSATVTTAAGPPVNAGVPTTISLATQIDLTMCSSSSSGSNGSTTATMTTAGGSIAASSGAISVAVQNQSSSSMLPPATILSSSDPVPDVVFRPNDFSSLMATQQLRAAQCNTSLETDLLRMQTTLDGAKFDIRDDDSTSQVGGAFGSGADISGGKHCY